jgi:hypothetical protein
MNIEQSASDYTEDNINNTSNGHVDEEVSTKSNGYSSSNPILNFLKSKTGTGTIESYNNHPLNFKNNHFLSQVIRGLTGLIGSLDLALIDVVIGTIGYFKEVKDV